MLVSIQKGLGVAYNNLSKATINIIINVSNDIFNDIRGSINWYIIAMIKVIMSKSANLMMTFQKYSSVE